MSTLTLEFIGHATFVLSNGDTSLILDPYPDGSFARALGLLPIEREFDFWVSSHDHIDHAGGPSLPGSPPELPDNEDTFQLKRVVTDHDEYGGQRRGGQVDILIIESAGKKIVHASDIGRSPCEATITAISGADVLIVPVGGFYTLGAAQAWELCLRCRPRAIVPMHYGSESTSLPLRNPTGFFAVAEWGVERRNSLDLLGKLPNRAIFAMEPTRHELHL